MEINKKRADESHAPLRARRGQEEGSMEKETAAGRRPSSTSKSPALRPGISYTLEDCRGRWSYMVSEGSPHIKRGYRLGLSFTQCLRSMFQLHNETVNVWSHLFGAMLFVSLVFYVKDSSAFERPRAIVQRVVGSMPFRADFNSSIFDYEFCGADDGTDRFNASNSSALNSTEAALNRTQTCKRINEQMAFSSARRHFAAAKNILQHVEFKLPGLERWREVLDANMMGRSVAQEAQHVQLKLDEAMLNLEESLASIRSDLKLLGSASMEGCVLCWVELVRRLAGVRASLQEQMASINKVTLGLERTDGGRDEAGTSEASDADAAWGLSPREWADYTLSEVASVTTALNNGIAASKRALSLASGSLHHEMLQELYSKVSEVGLTRELLQDIFPDSLIHRLRAGGGVHTDSSRLPDAEAGEDRLPMERWPIVAFLMSAVTCLTTSASYHLFNCHSLTVSNFLLLLDYAGISVLICGSFFPPIFYGFYCDVGLRNLYLALIFVLSAFSSGVGIYSGLWPSEGLKFVRVIAYSANALFAVFPCGHLAVRYMLGEPCWVASLVYITIMLGLYALGSVIYFYQFPEKYWPGKFDLVFSSHQLWHLIVFAAAFLHYFCAVGHFHWRVDNACPVLA